MASGMSTEVIEKSVNDLLVRCEGQSNHAFREMAPQFISPILKANGLDEATATRIFNDILYLAGKVRGLQSPMPVGKLAFKQAQLDQLAAQIIASRKGQ